MNYNNQLMKQQKNVLLQQDVTKLAKQLSGCNKRQLCLAMALLKGSHVLFLNEPIEIIKIIYTSGIDPVPTRKIWSILQGMKNEGRCLILTTHHLNLDETEVLSERIAIKAYGKLLTVGSVDCIKKNSDIGYHLNIYIIWQVIKINGKINKKKLNHQQQIKQKNFNQNHNQRMNVQVFVFIFCKKNDITIQISLMMNKLEEAFINIGKDEEAFVEKLKMEVSCNNRQNLLQMMNMQI